MCCNSYMFCNRVTCFVTELCVLCYVFCNRVICVITELYVSYQSYMCCNKVICFVTELYMFCKRVVCFVTKSYAFHMSFFLQTARKKFSSGTNDRHRYISIFPSVPSLQIDWLLGSYMS
jgi:hypothetical protein